MNVDFMYVTQRSQVGSMVLDVLVTEKLELPATATKFPVEDGTEMSDHITQGPESLHISGLISATDALEFSGGSGYKIIEALDVMRKMHKDRTPITVITGMTRYTDMAITSLVASRSNGGDKGGNWLEISAEMVQIKKVSLRTTEISEAKAAPAARGRAGRTQQAAGRSTTGETLGPPTPPTSMAYRLGIEGTAQGTPLDAINRTVRSGLGL